MTNNSGTLPFAPFDRHAIALHVARDIPEGWYINLGVGMPTLVADLVPAEREVVFHSENGILGMGPVPDAQQVDPWIVNAGKQHVTLRPGAALFHHADSFAMIRGGHIDLCVLGAFEVSERGDLANWTLTSNDRVPAVGGAMDLAVGAKNIWVMMEHMTRHGQPKLVQKCQYPLTAAGVVKRVYTDLAVLNVTPDGFEVIDIAPGLDFEQLQARTGAPLRVPKNAG